MASKTFQVNQKILMYVEKLSGRKSTNNVGAVGEILTLEKVKGLFSNSAHRPDPQSFAEVKV